MVSITVTVAGGVTLSYARHFAEKMHDEGVTGGEPSLRLGGSLVVVVAYGMRIQDKLQKTSMRPTRISRRQHSPILIVIAVTIALLSACTTTIVRTSAGSATLEDDMVAITADYWSPQALQIRYGVRLNPFVAPPMISGAIEFLVFEVRATSNDGVRTFDLQDIELQFGDRRYLAAQPEALAGFWRDTSIFRSASEEEQATTIRLIRDQLANSAVTNPTSLHGLLVFRGRSLPARGPATLTFVSNSLETGRRTRHRVRVMFQ